MLDNMLAYAEIDEILNLLEDKYREKVPEKVRTFFREEKMPEYTPTIDVNIPLIEQNLKRETIVWLAILNINYWCENEEEKQFFLNELDKNEEEKKKIEEKYNPDNLFKNKQERMINESMQTGQDLIVYKETSFISKLLNKIKQLFRKK